MYEWPRGAPYEFLNRPYTMKLEGHYIYNIYIYIYTVLVYNIICIYTY